MENFMNLVLVDGLLMPWLYVCVQQRDAEQSLSEAGAFLCQMAQEGGEVSASRMDDVKSQLSEQGWWRMNQQELEWAGKWAWRNSEKCIGRLFWEKLEVVDAQDVTSAAEVFKACMQHLRKSTNGGKIIPMVTFFPPKRADGWEIKIHSHQLVRYAGYQLEDGSVLGDPDQVKMTQWAIELGWQPPADKSQFDVLPLIIEYPGEGVKCFPVPQDAVLEVPIIHRDFDWFAELGLKWHALPAVSNRVLDAGGMQFTAAPFSGYYMGTEIGARNFGDTYRYNMLKSVAKMMGLDTSKGDSLWKDRAMIELNSAVLYSFRQAGVTIVDHHTASRQFLQHIDNEEKCGRTVPGQWSWIVPPISGSACPVYHRGYSKERPKPRFRG
ncbi:nitric-oxide synthase [Rubritalea squalenifaciens DSM 18772]|uniref:Nitric oxide synthase oxygenase n=2 Tax=Rubritalea squalenifaciens TaxID=407226 RepID=A0A1M6E3Q2_9BACT|nr:nitric-oxide synthase [Rubritalea squalenifaciens DSM 18772]